MREKAVAFAFFSAATILVATIGCGGTTGSTSVQAGTLATETCEGAYSQAQHKCVSAYNTGISTCSRAPSRTCSEEQSQILSRCLGIALATVRSCIGNTP